MKKPHTQSHIPAGTAEEIETLCTYLRRRRNWARAREIKRRLGYNDRKIRVLVEHAQGRILSAPGSNGYRYFNRLALRHAEPAMAATWRQIRRMQTRLDEYKARLAELKG